MSARAMAHYWAEMAGQPVPQMCPECADTGYVRYDVPVGDPNFGKIERCPTCGKEARAKWLAQNCGLNQAEMEARWADWKAGKWDGETPEVQDQRRKQRQAGYMAIKAALEKRTGLFTFYGDFGAGKSLALQIVANEARLQMTESYYAPFSLLLDHLRSLYALKANDSHFWQRLLDIPVLCVDEVTRFNETPWAKERLFVLADTRYRRRQSHLTLFATNDDPRLILPTDEDVGYLYSRLRQGALVELRGDMRLAGK